MLWVKLTVLEANFIKDLLEEGSSRLSDIEEAIELLETAVEHAEDEEIPEE